jgi:micrococcal nuclease
MFLSAKQPVYQYGIEQVTKYIDGDTIDVVIDLGFGIYVNKRIRLYGIDTPEIRTRDKEEKKRGKESLRRLKELCTCHEGDKLVLLSHGIGKYGRVLGELFNKDCSVNKMLLIEGFADVYEE